MASHLPELGRLDKARLGLPSPRRNITLLAHQANTLGIVAGAVRRVSIGSLAGGTRVVAAKGTVDSGKLLLLRGCGNHVLSSLLGPSVDEVTVRAPSGTAGKLDGCLAAPAVGQGLAQVPADAEAQLRHRLHALGTPVGSSVVARLVSRLERLLVDALREVEQLLEMGAARLGREAIGVKSARFALAGPLRLCVGNHISLRRGRGLSGHHLQVLWDGHLGGGLSEVVVGAETRQGHRLVRVSAVRRVQGRGDPVDGQIVGVLGVGAALLQLGAGRGARGDGIGAEERVHVGLVKGAREDDGIDVLLHERLGHVDLGVSLGSSDEEAGGEKNGRRHPVPGEKSE